MNNPLNLEQQSFELSESEDLLGLAKSLVNGRHPGILGTVDDEGNPQLRWMSSLNFDDFPIFYSLTSPTSNKVGEIKNCPKVNWMFFNGDCSLVLNLHGQAKIIGEPAVLKQVWQKIVDMSHPYFLDQYASKLGFVVIETTVNTIECTSPSSGLRLTWTPEELSART